MVRFTRIPIVSWEWHLGAGLGLYYLGVPKGAGGGGELTGVHGGAGDGHIGALGLLGGGGVEFDIRPVLRVYVNVSMVRLVVGIDGLFVREYLRAAFDRLIRGDSHGGGGRVRGAFVLKGGEIRLAKRQRDRGTGGSLGRWVSGALGQE